MPLSLKISSPIFSKVCFCGERMALKPMAQSAFSVVCMRVHACMCVYVHAGAHAEIKGQPSTLFEVKSLCCLLLCTPGWPRSFQGFSSVSFSCLVVGVLGLQVLGIENPPPACRASVLSLTHLCSLWSPPNSPAGLGIEPRTSCMQEKCSATEHCVFYIPDALDFRNSVLGVQLLPGLAKSETAHNSPPWMHKTTSLEPTPNGVLYLTLTHQANISRILTPPTKAGFRCPGTTPLRKRHYTLSLSSLIMATGFAQATP